MGWRQHLDSLYEDPKRFDFIFSVLILSSSLYTMLKLSQTTSSPFPFYCIPLHLPSLSSWARDTGSLTPLRVFDNYRQHFHFRLNVRFLYLVFRKSAKLHLKNLQGNANKNISPNKNNSFMMKSLVQMCKENFTKKTDFNFEYR